jgi:uridine monophosphate synthetase
MISNDKKDLIHTLHNAGVIKFGEFRLKSGLLSPFYIDLRIIISFPKIMKLVTKLFAEKAKNIEFDVIAGIPYTALPMASLLADYLEKPLVYARKETKAYGTGKLVEGIYEKGQTCLILDDLITTGESKLETSAIYEKSELVVKDMLILIDRSPNGSDILANKGYKLHSVLHIDEIVEELVAAKKLDASQVESIRSFIHSQTTDAKKTFRQRLEIVENTRTKSLIETMLRKNSNLVISLDEPNNDIFFKILKAVGSEIVMVKTHVDIMESFDNQFLIELKELATKLDFHIFEDRKFADIGNTVRHQFQGGLYKISDWADFVTVHSVSGAGVLDGLMSNLVNPPSAFLLARMSSKGNLISEDYTRRTIDMGKDSENVTGYIGHGTDVEDLARFKAKIPEHQLLLMPGVQLQKGSDGLGQQYVSVAEAMEGGADLIIVGRGIIAAENPAQTASIYRKTAWDVFKGKLDSIED